MDLLHVDERVVVGAETCRMPGGTSSLTRFSPRETTFWSL